MIRTEYNRQYNALHKEKKKAYNKDYYQRSKLVKPKVTLTEEQAYSNRLKIINRSIINKAIIQTKHSTLQR